IGKHPKSDYAGGITVVRTHRNILPSCANLYPGVLAFVLERLRPAVRVPRIEPKTIAIGIRSGGLLVTRLIDQAEVIPPVVTAGASRFVLNMSGLGLFAASQRNKHHQPDTHTAQPPYLTHQVALLAFLRN